jgi:hypothetical protein
LGAPTTATIPARVMIKETKRAVGGSGGRSWGLPPGGEQDEGFACEAGLNRA